jgi:hypothetical protein
MRKLTRTLATRILAVLVLAGLFLGLFGVTPAQAAAPTIASFNPTSGPVGTTVTITGTNFESPSVTNVKFDGSNAGTFTVVNDTTITATVPSNGTDGPIKVRNADGTATSATDFNVTTSSSNAPTITSFSPTSGSPGTLVTIKGTHFQHRAVTDVEFDGHNAGTFTVVNDTTITATVPSNGTDGPIKVRNADGTATSAKSFNVTQASKPTITSFTPTVGPIGTSVLITGTNFSGTGFTTSSVRFHGVTAAFTVNSATKITATVPTGASTGRISLTTPGGTATSTSDFVVRTLHARIVTLDLRGHLTAQGNVMATDGFANCQSGVSVKIQRRRLGGRWRTVRMTSTGTGGAYQVGLPDRPGSYRALAPRTGTNADVCLKDKSPRRRHRH